MLESAFGWIGQIIEWFGQFIPRLLILDTTQGGVKFRRGNEITELKPGVHVYWPIITIIKVFPVARQTIDLTAQTFETKDGKAVQVSGMIRYSVTDVVALLTETFDPDNTIRDTGMSVLHDILIQYTWNEIREGMINGVLPKELVKEVQKELKPYGVKVQKVGIKDMVGTTVYKVALEQSTDGLH